MLLCLQLTVPVVRSVEIYSLESFSSATTSSLFPPSDKSPKPCYPLVPFHFSPLLIAQLIPPQVIFLILKLHAFPAANFILSSLLHNLFNYFKNIYLISHLLTFLKTQTILNSWSFYKRSSIKEEEISNSWSNRSIIFKCPPHLKPINMPRIPLQKSYPLYFSKFILQ